MKYKILIVSFFLSLAFQGCNSQSKSTPQSRPVQAPFSLSYSNTNLFFSSITLKVGTSYSLNPNISGSSISQYSISPSLSDGLSFDSKSGIISGTPTDVLSTQVYTITASN